jgi:transposase
VTEEIVGSASCPLTKNVILLPRRPYWECWGWPRYQAPNHKQAWVKDARRQHWTWGTRATSLETDEMSVKGDEMRTIGIDLSVSSGHKAIVADEQGRYVSPVVKVLSEPGSLRRLLEIAQEGNPDGQMQVVLEPTGMAWLPVAAYLIRQGVTAYLVNGQQVADLRRYYKKHAKSDRIDCRVLAKLPLVNQENLYRLDLPSATTLACQRGCKQLERLQKQITATKNRLIALDRFAWPGLEQGVFPEAFAPVMRWFRQHWYNPGRVVAVGVSGLRKAWQDSRIVPDDPAEWAGYLVNLAQQVLELYGEDSQQVDFEQLQAEAVREQDYLSFVEQQHNQLQNKTVRPLYRQLHPSRNLETIPGVGQDGACVYASFIANPERFSSLRKHRGWSGMVPNSKQSANAQSLGLKITQAGPRLIKKFSFLDAETARLRDPQIAAIYYDQMVHKGKHHTQAICTCATHVLDRVLVVLRDDRPYELRDVDGTPLSKEFALEIIQERYQVPDTVRQRNRKSALREQREARAEKRIEGKLRK